MATGGSSGRGSTGLGRSFDFGSDDVLCSYDDYTAQRSDPSGKDFSENRLGRPSINVHSHEDDVISAVEKCMKKYADNLLRCMEGISGRLSHLEVYCYKLERSVGEFRSDLIQDQEETDLKFKSLEKHLQEVHRSVQILRDKQELSETQKELAKLKVSDNESPSSSHPQPSEVIVQPVLQLQNPNEATDLSSNHLALALPHQIPSQSSFPAKAPQQNQVYKEPPPVQQQLPLPSLSMQQDLSMVNQGGSFYSQSQLQYSQPSPQVPMVNQTQLQPLPPQYQQQWPQKPPQQFPPQPAGQLQNPASEAQARPLVPPSYSPYLPPSNASPETFRSGTPVPTPYSAIPNRPEALPVGYGGPAVPGSQPSPPQPPPPQMRPAIQHQQLPQANQSPFQPSLGRNNFMGSLPMPYTSMAPQANVQGYGMSYIDASKGTHHPPSYQPETYPPGGNPVQLPQHPGPQLVQNTSYGEIIEKAINMGYPRDHVLGVMRRMDETGQPINLNALLDRLNTRPPAATRAWSG